MLSVSDLQHYMPPGMKFFLKRYYRTFFPNKLILYFSPTSRCNYRCSYCPVITKFDYAAIYPKKHEKSVAEWLQAFEGLPGAMLYIAGGEPFLYNGLPDLLNQLPAKHQIVGIVTNLSLDVRLYRKVKRKIHIRASFHREFIGQEEFVAKVKMLSDQFYINVNIVATPENLPLIQQIADTMAHDNVTLHVDPYVDLDFRYTPEQRALLDRVLRSDRNPDSQLDFNDFSEKSCSAGRNYINVMSNGDVFACNGGMQYLKSALYAGFPNPGGMDLQKFAVGNLFDPTFQLNPSDIVCTLPCKEACDRDSVSVRQIGPARAVASAPGLRVIS
jgi:MoaA/NifB/PqqE/SkfB family radical SAM enzyme